MEKTPILRDLKLCRGRAVKAIQETAEAHGEDPDIPFDRENAFQLYAVFCGDAERTAHALNVTAADVQRVATAEGWTERLSSIIALKKSGRPGDVERALSRALNFVQAHRMRLFLNRVIQKLCAMSDGELEKYCLAVEEAADGTITRRITARPFADLTAALEKCQMLTYYALADTASERVKRNETTDDGASAGEIHAAIAEAMAKVRASRTPTAMLFDAQLEEAQKITGGATAPEKKDSE
jgi:hypothetical protein